MAVVRGIKRNFPFIGASLKTVKDEGAKAALTDVMDIVRRLRDHIGEIVNFNNTLYFSQNAVPTTSDLSDGQVAVWKDADATMGNPTHFIVYRDGSDILTFASVETVP